MIGEDEVHEPFLLGLDDGYLAYSLEPAHAWFSADGSAWQAVDLPHAEAPCVEDDEAYPDRIEGAAATGSEIVLLGVTSVAHPVTGDCALLSMAWVSSDGRTWLRSDPFGELRRMYVLDAPTSTVVWATDDSFEALIHLELQSQLWASADGLRWERVDVDLPANWARATGAAAADGTRLLSLYATCPGTCIADQLDQLALVSSADGVAWPDFESPAASSGEEWVITTIRAPSRHAAYWTLVAQRLLDPEEFVRESAIWTSADLRSWQRHDAPMPRLGDTLATSVGLIVTGCEIEWEDCQALVTDTSSSSSGWRPLAAPGNLLAEGPAGLIAIGFDGRTWRFVQD